MGTHGGGHGDPWRPHGDPRRGHGGPMGEHSFARTQARTKRIRFPGLGYPPASDIGARLPLRCRPRSEDTTTTTTTQRASTAPCSHRAQGILIWLIRMRGRHNNGLGMQTSIYSYKQTSIYSYAQMANSQLGASWHKAHGHLTESGWRCCQAQQEALSASLLQLDLCSG